MAVGRATSIRGVARFEHERRVGRRLHHDRMSGVQHEHAAVETLADFNTAASQGAAWAAGRHVHDAAAEAHGVIAPDDPVVAAAELGPQLARRRPPGRCRIGRRPREAVVEVSQKGRQKGIGGLKRAEVTQAQFAGEAVLQRAPQSFDAPFGLRRARGDEADAQGPEHPAEVRGLALALQLLGN